jgi:hypothetical protein
MSPSVMPKRARSCGDKPECEVVAGRITKLSTPPRLATWIGNFTSLTNSSAAMVPPFAMADHTDEPQQVLNNLRESSFQRYVSAYNLAILYVGLGQKDKALEWLQNVYADCSIWLIGIKVELMLNGLRSDPRFTELMRRVEFVP